MDRKPIEEQEEKTAYSGTPGRCSDGRGETTQIAFSSWIDEETYPASYMTLPTTGSKVPEKRRKSCSIVFILAGGSNMVGHGPVSKSDQVNDDPRVVALSNRVSGYLQEEPVLEIRTWTW